MYSRLLRSAHTRERHPIAGQTVLSASVHPRTRGSDDQGAALGFGLGRFIRAHAGATPMKLAPTTTARGSSAHTRERPNRGLRSDTLSRKCCSFRVLLRLARSLRGCLPDDRIVVT